MHPRKPLILAYRTPHASSLISNELDVSQWPCQTRYGMRLLAICGAIPEHKNLHTSIELIGVIGSPGHVWQQGDTDRPNHLSSCFCIISRRRSRAETPFHTPVFRGTDESNQVPIGPLLVLVRNWKALQTCRPPSVICMRDQGLAPETRPSGGSGSVLGWCGTLGTNVAPSLEARGRDAERLVMLPETAPGMLVAQSFVGASGRTPGFSNIGK